VADSGAMRALSVRQPYAELILRGMKVVEYRSRPTRIIGERFHLDPAEKWPGAQIKKGSLLLRLNSGFLRRPTVDLDTTAHVCQRTTCP
jgi:hypothetical protein